MGRQSQPDRLVRAISCEFADHLLAKVPKRSTKSHEMTPSLLKASREELRIFALRRQICLQLRRKSANMCAWFSPCSR